MRGEKTSKRLIQIFWLGDIVREPGGEDNIASGGWAG